MNNEIWSVVEVVEGVPTSCVFFNNEKDANDYLKNVVEENECKPSIDNSFAFGDYVVKMFSGNL